MKLAGAVVWTFAVDAVGFAAANVIAVEIEAVAELDFVAVDVGFP